MIQPDTHTTDVTRAELATLRQAMTQVPPPPYVVTEAVPSSRTVWTLQRGTTPEGTEPGLVWLIYVDGPREVSGPARDKSLPPPTVPLDATADVTTVEGW